MPPMPCLTIKVHHVASGVKRVIYLLTPVLYNDFINAVTEQFGITQADDQASISFVLKDQILGTEHPMIHRYFVNVFSGRMGSPELLLFLASDYQATGIPADPASDIPCTSHYCRHHHWHDTPDRGDYLPPHIPSQRSDSQAPLAGLSSHSHMLPQAVSPASLDQAQNSSPAIPEHGTNADGGENEWTSPEFRTTVKAVLTALRTILRTEEGKVAVEEVKNFMRLVDSENEVIFEGTAGSELDQVRSCGDMLSGAGLMLGAMVQAARSTPPASQPPHSPQHGQYAAVANPPTSSVPASPCSDRSAGTWMHYPYRRYAASTRRMGRHLSAPANLFKGRMAG